ncbi:MAG: hypothetical protein IJD26_00165 [Lachnospiraceae bacterium]|nr:hypothetical protein [Lachnospiraceae bacterium]
MTVNYDENEQIPENTWKDGVIRDNRGVGVVEVILILVVLIALVLIFKEQLGSMVTKAMNALEKSMNEVLS